MTPIQEAERTVNCRIGDLEAAARLLVIRANERYDRDWTRALEADGGPVHSDPWSYALAGLAGAIVKLDAARSSSPAPAAAVSEERVREIAVDAVCDPATIRALVEKVRKLEDLMGGVDTDIDEIWTRIDALETARAAPAATLEARVEDLEKWRDAANPVQYAAPFPQDGESAEARARAILAGVSMDTLAHGWIVKRIVAAESAARADGDAKGYERGVRAALAVREMTCWNGSVGTEKALELHFDKIRALLSSPASEKEGG